MLGDADAAGLRFRQRAASTDDGASAIFLPRAATVGTRRQGYHRVSQITPVAC